MRTGDSSRLISFLAEFCVRYRVEEKIFIVSSYRAGYQIGLHMAKEGNPWINLRFATMASLAAETADVSSRGLRQISDAGSQFLIEDVINDLQSGNRLEYFSSLKRSSGNVKAVWNTINELRMQAIFSDSMDPSVFINPQKGMDLKLLCAGYEKVLENKNLIDRADLLLIAAASAESRAPEPNKYFLAIPEDPLWILEKRLLRNIAGDRLIWVPKGKVIGLPAPRRSPPELENRDLQPADGSEDAKTDCERLSWIFAPEKAPETFKDDTLEIFGALGPGVECREVLRCIFKEKWAWDEVEVIFPPGPLYPALFHHIRQKSGLKVTCSGGFPSLLTSPGRLILGLVDWMGNGYHVNDLCRLFESRALAIPARSGISEVSGIHAVRLLKEAMIGWGRERYLPRLRNLLLRYRQKKDFCDGVEYPEFRSDETTVRITGLLDFLERLFANLPPEDENGRVEFPALCFGISRLLTEVAGERTDFDLEAMILLKSRLDDVAELTSIRPSLSEAAEWLRGLVSALSIGGSNPLPGHLHLADHHSGGYSGRAVTFFVGLDMETFPGAGRQDPFLLDEERERISPDLLTSGERLRESLYGMAVLLSSLRGKVIFSCPVFDPVEDKVCFPSSLLLQVFRLQHNRPEFDYSELEKVLIPPAGFVPMESSGFWDDRDWWLAGLYSDIKAGIDEDSVRAVFPDLARGFYARVRRNSMEPSVFDGFIENLSLIFPAASSPEKVFSASQLEKLAGCPFFYLMKYILGLEKWEELEFDPASWLGAKHRGTLLHDIFYRFMREIREKGEKPDPQQHQKELIHLADQLMNQIRESIPPPTDGVYQYERLGILNSMSVFLAAEKKGVFAADPVLLEAAFGMSGGEKGMEETIDLPISSGTVRRFRGRIDRIDRIQGNSYRVIDYKTGKFKPEYENLECFGFGLSIQHALYAAAAEVMLSRLGVDSDPRVLLSGYYFPTDRGDGREVMIKDVDRDILRKILEVLFAIIDEGAFLPAPDLYCSQCDFFAICGPKAAERSKQRKKINPEAYALHSSLKLYP